MMVNQYENSPPSPAIGGGGFLDFRFSIGDIGDFRLANVGTGPASSKRIPLPRLQSSSCKRLIRAAED
jgi:hypothetical protein